MEKLIHANITVTHINIRESISILLLKLIALDVISVIFATLFFSFASFSPTASITEKILSYNVLFFALLGVFKITFTSYIILLWLNEYFEITPTAVIHKKGIFYRDTQRYELEFVRTIKVSQGLLGKLLNFGSIELQDIRRNTVLEMYMIHNPHRHKHILERLLGNPHEEKHELRKIFIEKADDDDADGEQT